ncbi:S26 family signal peptidase [Aureimonas sp. SA4125]|uniref:S26 family signal peptidase n=1 Tax=Aureimonas sp. SA4125 TaxID=2826993 RepID=UPI001CC4FD1C|nr:S26 family signal peptidase [Aureimonas sp. SA4125]
MENPGQFRVEINRQPLDRSDLRRTDAEGRQLVAFPSGAVPAGHLFLHSAFGGSYDSRYFGPIPTDGLRGLARPILTMVR